MMLEIYVDAEYGGDPQKMMVRITEVDGTSFGKAVGQDSITVVQEAICEPKPVQRPLPPIWLGETSNPVMVEAIARHADVFNSMPVSLEGLREKLRVVDEACGRIGRDPSTLDRSLETQVLVCESDARIDDCFERIKGL